MHLHKETIRISLLFVASRSGLRARRSAIRGGSSVGFASIVLHSSHVTSSGLSHRAYWTPTRRKGVSRYSPACLDLDPRPGLEPGSESSICWPHRLRRLYRLLGLLRPLVSAQRSAQDTRSLQRKVNMDFFFSYGSTYTYLSVMRVEQASAAAGVAVQVATIPLANHNDRAEQSALCRKARQAEVHVARPGASCSPA